jgi:hypothetical protein
MKAAEPGMAATETFSKGHKMIIRKPARLVLASLLFLSPAAFAHTLKDAVTGGGCSKNGNTCNVFCNNGDKAGDMNWNGTVWTNGTSSDADMETEANAICAANGTACK